MRPAARLVQLARSHRSDIWLKMGGRVANLRSILSVMGLCAVMGTTLEVEARGEDEDIAIRAVEIVFTDDISDEVETTQPLNPESTVDTE